MHAQAPALVDEAFDARFAAEFPDLSPRLRHKVLIESGLALTPLVEGVRQDANEHLDRTLTALAAEYESGDAARRAAVRALVLESRRHTELAARHKPKDEEMLLLRTWLENPLIFSAWLRLRRRACQRPPDAM